MFESSENVITLAQSTTGATSATGMIYPSEHLSSPLILEGFVLSNVYWSLFVLFIPVVFSILLRFAASGYLSRFSKLFFHDK